MALSDLQREQISPEAGPLAGTGLVILELEAPPSSIPGARDCLMNPPEALTSGRLQEHRLLSGHGCGTWPTAVEWGSRHARPPPVLGAGGLAQTDP